MEDVTKIVTISDATTAYNLDLGFRYDYIEVKNVTKWATDSTKVLFYAYKDMADGYYYGMENLGTVATNGQKPIAGTSNGFTPYDTGAFAARQVLVDTGSTKITQATQAVVTSTAHGLSTGDKVTFQNVTVGMTQINGLSTEVKYLTADTFSCDNIDSTGFTAWSSSETLGQFIRTSDRVEDTGFKGVTLGTDILATNADVLVVRAIGEGNYALVTQA